MNTTSQTYIKHCYFFCPCVYFGPSPALGNPISWTAWPTKNSKNINFIIKSRKDLQMQNLHNIPKNETYKYNRI